MKVLYLLSGSLFSFVLASQINRIDLPDAQFTKIPAVLLPFGLSLLFVFGPSLFKRHFLLVEAIFLPIISIVSGFYIFGFVLRNLH